MSSTTSLRSLSSLGLGAEGGGGGGGGGRGSTRRGEDDIFNTIFWWYNPRFQSWSIVHSPKLPWYSAFRNGQPSSLMATWGGWTNNTWAQTHFQKSGKYHLKRLMSSFFTEITAMIPIKYV